MDMSGIEPDPSRMLSERDNQLHHMPVLESRSNVEVCTATNKKQLMLSLCFLQTSYLSDRFYY